MEIKIDDLSNEEVIKLLEEHLADMYAVTPPESVHALDVDHLKSTEITFFSGWLNGKLMGCLAIKELDRKHIELKSMRTSIFARQSGVASRILNHVLELAKSRGYAQVSIETGSQDYFKAARNLYEKFGFRYCGPFADYKLDSNSKFMTLYLDQKLT